MKGYAGKILRVNLTTGQIKVEEPDEHFYRKYYGGTGFIAHYLLSELPKGIDPLGPENKVIFALGPINGQAVAGAGRNGVGAKSPLTGGIGFAEAGGFWGPELKKAGFDAIIIEGKAEKPSYLWVHDGEAEIRDGSAIWGKTTAEVEDIIRDELGDPRIRVAQCGLAGEKQVRYACVLNDVTHAYGRTGIGAVMGSKNLRAVAVRGTMDIPVADKAKLVELNRWFATENKPSWEGMRDLGTAGGLTSLHASSGLPTKNFKYGQFEGNEKISGQTMRDTVLVKRDNCYACPIFCKRVVRTGPPYNVDPRYGGPEYETLGSFGSTCGVDDLEAVCKANELCNAYGLDTISTGMTVAFAMECYENGLLTKEDMDGLDARFGNAEAMVKLVEKIAHREGVGDLLAEGTKRAAEKIGKGAEQYAIQVKGQELPMHEPRLKTVLGVGYAVSPTGADHCHNIHDTGFVKSAAAYEALGVVGGPIPAEDLSERKVRIFATLLPHKYFTNCVCLCNFVNWGYDNTVELVRATTGWNTTLQEVATVAERAMTLARIFNLREGFTADDDRLPKRIHEAFVTGPLAGVAITPEQLDEAKRTYYEMMGWDRETGVPLRGKMKLLDIEWALDLLEQSEQK
ncbi:MAG TPA: aldehyde ferredoxin oxidoreductase family protein [Firmicutes bacterium]|nr:aldehyde ferredoxin oxidoreductase family protein [Candidatus Fermentithermobacillaceae bacterium]